MGERDLEDPLAALQRIVTDAVRLPSLIGEDEDLVRRVEELVAPSARGMSAVERLEVYREQFWLRHLPSLEDDYPTLAWAVGRDAFHALGTEYLLACPPRTWNLQELGADLPGYVASRLPWNSDAIACDAARLDWAFMEAFDAPDAPPLDPRALASVPEDKWQDARIAFNPSCRALPLAYPLHELRNALKQGHACERPAPQVSPTIVCRDAARNLHATAVEPLAFALITALREGALLGEACEHIARSLGETDPSTLGPRVGAWFQEWTARGWVTAVRF
jgi:hypothetical protein